MTTVQCLCLMQAILWTSDKPLWSQHLLMFGMGLALTLERVLISNGVL